MKNKLNKFWIYVLIEVVLILCFAWYLTWNIMVLDYPAEETVYFTDGFFEILLLNSRMIAFFVIIQVIFAFYLIFKMKKTIE
ncbi:MAG: hypothetical protein V4642_05755 [Bacteroidota bacterium]